METCLSFHHWFSLGFN